MLPTSTPLSVRYSPREPAKMEAAVYFAAKGAEPTGGLEADRSAAAKLVGASPAATRPREVSFLPADGGNAPRRVFVVGLGEPEKLTLETIRQAAGAAARALRKHGISSAAIILPGAKGLAGGDVAEAVVTGALLASFDYREYRGTGAGDEEKPVFKAMSLGIVPRGDQDLGKAVARAVAIAEAQNFARTIASRPGNDINPPSLARVAEQLAREAKLKITILDEKQMARLGMGGILGVGKGSATPPRLIALEYRPVKAKQKQPLLVVGKSITFDTGGISIKPAERMGEMVYDKCGGMAVLGLMAAVAKLKPAIPIVGILTSAENMPSSTAYRPGDLLRMFNGVTVEVTNTDAEGRLVLGDALAWGCKTYKPAAVVDLATLTGGCVVALGHTVAGLMSNSDELVGELQSAADAAGEKIWRLPLGDEQREIIKSHRADIVNSAGRWASPLQGGAFLSYFVPRDNSIPWAHLDIAGVADTDKELPYYARGATGWGVRTLVEWVTARAAR